MPFYDIYNDINRENRIKFQSSKKKEEKRFKVRFAKIYITH